VTGLFPQKGDNEEAKGQSREGQADKDHPLDENVNVTADISRGDSDGGGQAHRYGQGAEAEDHGGAGPVKSTRLNTSRPCSSVLSEDSETVPGAGGRGQSRRSRRGHQLRREGENYQPRIQARLTRPGGLRRSRSKTVKAAHAGARAAVPPGPPSGPASPLGVPYPGASTP